MLQLLMKGDFGTHREAIKLKTARQIIIFEMVQHMYTMLLIVNVDLINTVIMVGWNLLC